MKKLYLVWNKEMTECVGFLDESDAIYASTGDRAAADSYPGVSVVASEFRETYAEGSETGEHDYSSMYETIPHDLVTLPMIDIEIED